MRRAFVILLVVIVAAGVFVYCPRATGTSAANAATIAVFRGDVDSQHGSATFECAQDGDDRDRSWHIVRDDGHGQTVTTVRTAEGEVVVLAVFGCPPVTVGANQQTQVTQNGPRRRRSLSRSGRGCASPGPRGSDSWSVIPADSPAARPAEPRCDRSRVVARSA